jgi:hypothetical protein
LGFLFAEVEQLQQWGLQIVFMHTSDRWLGQHTYSAALHTVDEKESLCHLR